MLPNLLPSLAGDLSDAACQGEWDLFDSTDPSDHQLAKMICQECPVIDACRAHLRAAQDVGYAGISRNYGPSGTWAGQLFGERRKVKCGTESGYHTHKYRREPACGPCREEHNRLERERARARRENPEIARERTAKREQMAAEEALYTEAEGREAHAAWLAGDRDDWTVIGHRVWDRRRKRRHRKGEAA